MEIRGELYRPAGPGPFPAVVLLPPCDGRLPGPTERAEAGRYAGLGYVMLAVDSYGPRQIADGCSGAGSSVDVVMDAYGALLRVASLRFIDPERIAVIGFSRGGDAALTAVEFDGVGRLFDRKFSAAIAYYPSCQRQEAIAVSAPTLILVGELDDWTSAHDCRAMVDRRKDLGGPLRLVTYPGAYHAFNLDLPVRSFYGHHLQYDASAAQAAWTEVTAVLRQAFGR